MVFFSIITAVLNRKDDLPRMVNSVNVQSFKDYELIIVDNGSTDGTWEYCQKLKSKNVICVRCETQGLSFARNTGIKIAQSSWSVILDSDNQFVDKNSLQDIYNYIKKHENMNCILTKNKSISGKDISLCNYLDMPLNLKKYFSARGEFSACISTQWFKQHLYPEILGARTEFPSCVYADAAVDEKLVISSLVAQIYNDEGMDRISAEPLTEKRVKDLAMYYKMLLKKYAKELMNESRLAYYIFSIKFVMYSRMCKEKIQSPENISVAYFALFVCFIPVSLIRRMIEVKKRGGNGSYE